MLDVKGILSPKYIAGALFFDDLEDSGLEKGRDAKGKYFLFPFEEVSFEDNFGFGLDDFLANNNFGGECLAFNIFFQECGVYFYG